jgi:hypothetical protein
VKRTTGFIRTLAAGIALGAALYAYAPEFLRTGSAEPPTNFVAVSERIHTSGQPSAAQLGGLKDKGYGLVINLAPPTTLGSISDEGMFVADGDQLLEHPGGLGGPSLRRLRALQQRTQTIRLDACSGSLSGEQAGVRVHLSFPGGA